MLTNCTPALRNIGFFFWGGGLAYIYIYVIVILHSEKFQAAFGKVPSGWPVSYIDGEDY